MSQLGPPEFDQKRGNRAIWIIIVLFAGVMVLLNSGGNGREERGTASGPTSMPTEQAAYTENDIEYQLAVIDQGGYVDPSDPGIHRYGRVLDDLDEECGDGRRMLADMAVRSVQLLDDDGVSTTALEMLQSARRAIPSDMGRQESCSDIFATLMVLMTQ